MMFHDLYSRVFICRSVGAHLPLYKIYILKHARKKKKKHWQLSRVAWHTVNTTHNHTKRQKKGIFWPVRTGESCVSPTVTSNRWLRPRTYHLFQSRSEWMSEWMPQVDGWRELAKPSMRHGSFAWMNRCNTLSRRTLDSREKQSKIDFLRVTNLEFSTISFGGWCNFRYGL